MIERRPLQRRLPSSMEHQPSCAGIGGSLLRASAILLAISLQIPSAVAAQEAEIRLNPIGILPPPAERLAGAVGWRNSPRLAGMLRGLGAESGTYRRTLFVHDAASMTYLGRDLAWAKAEGMTTWLTCVGTPAWLSPNPDATGEEFNTGVPQFARYPPTDAVAWADEILAVLADVEAESGLAPDYLEIWNEPERVEWFKGDGDDYVEMYAPAAARLRAARPGLRIGGPGLAGWSSSFGGTGSFLFRLVESCAALQVPLDFVSWHNYAPATEILYSGVSRELKDWAASRGMPRLETAISEWNIYPAAEAAHATEFDGPHAAANLASLLACAAQTGLDRNMFFLDYDEDNDGPVTDLLGKSLGMITQHGLEKPCARLLRFVLDGARASQVALTQSPTEWNVRAQACLDGSRVRLIVSNDVVDGSWVFAKRSRENGMVPGWLLPIWHAAGGSNATEATLMAEGLTQAQAQAVLAFMPEVFLYDRFTRAPRPVAVQIDGTAVFQPTRVWRFTDGVNAPAQFEPVLRPLFEQAEDVAMRLSAAEGAAYLTLQGYPYTTDEVLLHLVDFFDWAANEGIPYGVAVPCYRILRESHRDGRLANAALLNDLPETRLTEEAPASAGVSIAGRVISFLLDPETSIVIEIEFTPTAAE